MSKQWTPSWREAHLQVRVLGSTACSDHFEGLDVVLRGRHKGFCTLPKVSKAWGFCSISKNDRRRGTCEEDLERCSSRGSRSTKDMFIRDVRRSGCWFPERGCILEHQIFRFAKMILRDRCSTSYDLASLLRGRRSTLHRWSGKIAERIRTRPVSFALNFPFLKHVSQNCFDFDVVNLKNEEVSQNCFVLTLSSSNIEEVSQNFSLWMLSSSKTEEVSQNGCVFKLADRQADRQTDR